ncbi:DUF5309 family protein [Microbispora sp. NPDC049633]|uniref:SU10 major capsid protein n=1 Tax=Microbispora sp. NPDC049633 TaxID=3154355 RepID=UPI003412F7FD
MSGITAMGTTFNLPNYTGQLFSLTPADTPLLSAIGGLTGGGMASSTEFEWQTFDLRDPSQRVQIEGATAPTAEGRVRANVKNVVQIHQSKVSVSYTKQSATGQLASPQSAPYNHPGGGANPVTNELDWQVQRAIEQIALDVNWSFINGTYNNPTSNSTARKTRGLLQAITTNKVSKASSTVTGLSSATDTITETATALSDGDKIVFTSTGDATGIVAGRVYYVVSKATNTFKVARTAGGSAITLGTSTSNIDYIKPQTTALATTDIDALLQLAYDNGGLTGGNATLLVNSSQKRAITAAYASAYGKTVTITEANRTVAGVSVQTIETDFGVLNLMLDRHVPQDAIVVLTLSQLRPVFLNVPGKGVFFEEPLAKTGASDDVQIYGEIGLAYGNEMAHAQLRGLAV